MRKILGLLILATAIQLAAAQATYVFEEDQLTGPETIAATGYYEITLRNNSTEDYDLAVLRLKEGKTTEDYQAALTVLFEAFESGGDVGAALQGYNATSESVGGVAPGAGEAATAGLLLEPGSYILDGSCSDCPPSQQMMVLTVTDGPRTEAPAADITVEMVDFNFSGLPSELEAGPKVWEVANTGEQSHVLILFKLAEGATLDDLTAFMETPEAMGGPAPAELGEDGPGSAFLSAGARYYQTINLEPGTYAVICPVPDTASGTPHHALGMIQSLIVK